MEKCTLQLFLKGASYTMPKDKSNYDKVLEKFGLFAGNSVQGYNPVNVAEDVIPKEEDFVMIPFRGLTATIVAGGSWRATNFSDEKVLKKSMDMLIGQPVYVNHDTDDVNNAIGVVASVKWSKENVAPDGTVIPAGIDVMLKIDAKANSKLARLMLMEPPAINSVSVTVAFEWEPSHKMEGDFQFEGSLGQMIDDRMVTRNVTKVIDYFEISVVWLGADPFAKKLDEKGNPIRVDKSSVYEGAYGKELYKNEQKLYADFSLSKGKNISLLGIDNQKENENTGKMKWTLAKLLEKLGLTDKDTLEIEGHEVTKTEEFTAIKAKADSVATLTADKGTLTTELEAEKVKVTERDSSIATLTADKKTLTTERDGLKIKADAFDKVVGDQRVECVRLYKLSVETPSEAIVELINKSEGAELAAFTKEYRATAKARLGSKAVTGEDEELKSEDKSGNTMQDIYDRFNKPTMNIGTGVK